MDAKNLSVLPDDAGWLIGYTEYLINVVPELTNDLPLLISSESEIDVAINLTDHKNFEAPVFLWDSNMDIYYNLKNQEITLKLPSGGSHEQFFITFNKKISVEEKEETPFPKEYKIFQNNPLHRAEIMSPPESSPEIITIYNLNGRKVREVKAAKNEEYHEISTSHLSKGLYIIKIITAEGTIVAKKVLISN